MTRRGRAACSSSPTLSPSDMGMGLHSIEWTCPECASVGPLFRTVDAESVSRILTTWPSVAHEQPTPSPAKQDLYTHHRGLGCQAGKGVQLGVAAELVSSDRERVNGHHLGAGGKGERVPDLFAAVESAAWALRTGWPLMTTPAALS
jgi:hypothetical protein